MGICEAHDIYQRFTQLNELSYCFTPKHHGGRDSRNATWLPELSRAEEFMVFDMADNHQLADASGNLYGFGLKNREAFVKFMNSAYGMSISPDFGMRIRSRIGTGIRCGRVGENGPENRTTQKYCPPKSVFERIIQAGIVSGSPGQSA